MIIVSVQNLDIFILPKVAHVGKMCFVKNSLLMFLVIAFNVIVKSVLVLPTPFILRSIFNTIHFWLASTFKSVTLTMVSSNLVPFQKNLPRRNGALVSLDLAHHFRMASLNAAFGLFRMWHAL